MRDTLAACVALTMVLAPGLAEARGEHVAVLCAFEADPFCGRLLAELKSSGYKVDKLPDQADLDAELAAPGAVVQIRQSPWEVVLWVRRDGKREMRSFKPEPKEADPARLVALQVAESMRASFIAAASSERGAATSSMATDRKRPAPSPAGGVRTPAVKPSNPPTRGEPGSK
ncbi:MAG: hypothetical protein HY901_34280 [Deltaproteobacteria bacterium]|nr:hypothetical protein [Deltaproteobacteria bacterium]